MASTTVDTVDLVDLVDFVEIADARLSELMEVVVLEGAVDAVVRSETPFVEETVSGFLCRGRCRTALAAWVGDTMSGSMMMPAWEIGRIGSTVSGLFLIVTILIKLLSHSSSTSLTELQSPSK